MYDFTYSKPASVPDALKTLGADPEAKLLAGGQTYIPVLKQRLAKPTSIVDLSSLGLAGITVEGDKIKIGAMTTHHQIESNEAIKSSIPGLAKMASWIGDTQVRHRGTMGGSLANNDPSACYPAAVLACNATIVTDRRSITADDFFQGMFTTALEPDEMITAIEFPKVEKVQLREVPQPGQPLRHGRRLHRQGPNRHPRGDQRGRAGRRLSATPRWSRRSRRTSRPTPSRTSRSPPDGLNGDIHASAEYRAHLIGVMARRCVAGA